MGLAQLHASNVLMFAVGWSAVLDFAAATLCCYLLLRWARTSRASRVLLAAAGLCVTSVLVRRLGLDLTGGILNAASALVLVALVVVFRPEVRRGFLSIERWFRTRSQAPEDLSDVYEEIAAASFHLAERGLGALVVVAPRGYLGDIEEIGHGGLRIDSKVSARLLESLFLRQSSLHDGAAIVQGARLTEVGVVLPASPRDEIPKHGGTRHRAGLGFSECCDVPVVVVSEERREVSLAFRETLRTIESPAELEEELREANAARQTAGTGRDANSILADWKLELAAVGLAGFVWAVTSLGDCFPFR